jgi:hypothetical protein
MSKVLERSRLSVVLLLAVAFTFAAGCSKGGSTASGPAAAAARSYFEAVVRKDSAAAKRYLSAGTIRKLEAESKDLDKPFDAAWRESVETTGGGTVPEIGSEKITGDTATVDLKGAGGTLTMPMVREGGEWKVALDKASPNERIFAGPAASAAQTPAPAEDKEEGDDEHNDKEDK